MHNRKHFTKLLVVIAGVFMLTACATGGGGKTTTSGDKTTTPKQNYSCTIQYEGTTPLVGGAPQDWEHVNVSASSSDDAYSKCEKSDFYKSAKNPACITCSKSK